MLESILPDMRKRNTTDHEEMERADADIEQLLRTIRQFRRINLLFSASRRILRRHVFRVMEQAPERTYTLLDLGAGGCDIARWAAREARRRQLKLEITALDNDPRILSVARETVRGYPEIRIVLGDALEPGELGSFDFVFSNHFLHHLDWEEIGTLLRHAIPRTRVALVMNDLKRSRWAYLGAAVGIGLLTRNSFALRDGLLSIRRGFLPAELREFLRTRFPEVPFTVEKAAPSRVVLLLSGHGQELQGRFP